MRVLDACLEQIENKEWKEEQAKESDIEIEKVVKHIQRDFPTDLVYQSEEFTKHNSPIFFEQFYEKVSSGNRDTGVAEELDQKHSICSQMTFKKMSSHGSEKEDNMPFSFLNESESDSDDDFVVEKKENHLIFLLHGYNSDADDLNKVYAAILRHSPKTAIHSIESIENIHDKGVFELGEIVAKECLEQIERVRGVGKLDKVSFLGFSFGGLIFRAAFEYLKDYKDNFFSFITLASPHFGCIYSESKLFSMGIWAFSKITSSPIIQQLRLGDAKDLYETALYKLSKKEGLAWFDSILLCGSYQDNYSPLESSLIQYSERLEQSPKIKLIKKM